MDQIAKFLQKLQATERALLLEMLGKIRILQFAGLDMKKLQGEQDLFRVRKGKIRIIFRREGNCISVINIDYRGNVYKKI